MSQRWFCRVLLVVTWQGLLPWSVSVAASPSVWLTGAAMQARLAAPVDDIYWSGTPLRQAMERLSRAERIAVLIDRRVDPNQRVEFSLSKVSLREALEQLAKRLDLGLSLSGALAYLGPPRAASRLSTLAELRREEARRLPAGAGRKLLQPERLTWADFATPRDLLSQLATHGGITILGLDLVPHDLWAASDLPPLALVDRLTLIAVQFDLTFEIAADGGGVTLVPVPDVVALVRSYPGGRQPQELAERWASLAPNSRIDVVGEKIFVKGPVEDHRQITDSLPTTRRPAARPASKRPGKGEPEKRYTLRVANAPLVKVLEELAARFELELKIDEAALKEAGISPQQPVSFSVQDATMDSLFEALLRPAGCNFRRQGKTLEVRPARR